MTTIAPPVLAPASMRSILVALAEDLRGRDITEGELHEHLNPELSATDEMETNGADWCTDAGQSWRTAYDPAQLVPDRHLPTLQPLTARRVLTALCDDLRERRVPVEHQEAHFTKDLEDSAQASTPTDWMEAAGVAWAAALRGDAHDDAAEPHDVGEDLVPADIVAELERAQAVRDAFYAHFPKQS